MYRYSVYFIKGLRLREVKCFSQSRTANKWEREHGGLVCLTPAPKILITVPCTASDLSCVTLDEPLPSLVVSGTR